MKFVCTVNLFIWNKRYKKVWNSAVDPKFKCQTILSIRISEVEKFVFAKLSPGLSKDFSSRPPGWTISEKAGNLNN